MAEQTLADAPRSEQLRRPCDFCGEPNNGYWWARYCSRRCRLLDRGIGPDDELMAHLTPTEPTDATETHVSRILNGSKPAEAVRGVDLGASPGQAQRPRRGSVDLGDGRRLQASGYVYLTAARMQSADGNWIAEHRWVMEQKLGRPLARGESVHHRNGVKHDNRPENLELWVGPIRAGQRAADLRCPHCGEVWYDEDAER